MAWNPSKEVAAARNIGNEFDCEQVIVLMISHKRGTMQAVSYGKTKDLCAEAKPLADAAYDAVFQKMAE